MPDEVFMEKEANKLKSKIQDLPQRQFSDDLLIKFLRILNYDLDKSVELFKEYCSAHKKSPENFCNAYDQIDFFKNGIAQFLPSKNRTDDMLYILRNKNWDPTKLPLSHGSRVFTLIHEFINLDPDVQINGVTVLLDLEGLGWKFIKSYGPKIAKKDSSMMEKTIPTKVNQLILFNTSKFASMMVTLITQCLSSDYKKIMKPVGKDLEKLHKLIPKEDLPIEYGGENGNLDAMGCFNKILSEEARLQEIWKLFK